MPTYEVANSRSGHSFGIYEADSPEAAIETVCRDAGYVSKAQTEEVMGRDSGLVACLVADDETGYLPDGANGKRIKVRGH